MIGKIVASIEPHHEKTCLRGFGPGPIGTATEDG